MSNVQQGMFKAEGNDTEKTQRSGNRSSLDVGHSLLDIGYSKWFDLA